MLSLVLNTYAIEYATDRASNPVTDLVLSNIPIFNVDALFVYGTLLVAIITVFVCLMQPKRLPMMLYGVALFFFIRSIFVSLTHIAPFMPYTSGEFGPAVSKLFFGGDRFFSGHTGLPFLGALAFWKEPFLRYFYLTASVFFGVIVLMGHLHYSIDVLSAFFITYSIYHLLIWLFPEEYALFTSEK
ncbi:MAG: hypothetical protein JWO43_61 [Candidatus Adlerbacteria bacterium]|nr:hypothetical protein [Candidatus Adlerbacteria bacterium]